MMSSDTSGQKVNPDDFIVDGYVTTLIADEDLTFGTFLKYNYIKDRITVSRSEDEFLIDDGKFAGRAIQTVKKGDPIKVLLSGTIFPKKNYNEHRMKLKQELFGAMLEAIGEAFGYVITFKKCGNSHIKERCPLCGQETPQTELKNNNGICNACYAESFLNSSGENLSPNGSVKE